MEFSWEKLVGSLKKEKEVALATIIDKKGSAPRSKGTMMLIHKDGTIEGTIGGGPVENEIINIGKKIINEKKSQILNVSFSGEVVICGGNVRILVEYLSLKDLDLYEKLLNNYNSGKTQYLVKDIKNFQSELIDFPNVPEKFKKYFNQQLKEKHFLKDNLFFQFITALPEIHIFGAGHIAVPLYEIAKLCEFKIFVYDDRKEFAKKERFPEAEVILVDMEKVGEKINFNPSCYFVLVTREHKHDEIVLKQLLGKPYAYIGMIGSKKRVRAVKERIINQGFNKDEVEKIHSPIGIDIGAETPAEIAVSIMAEIIKVLRLVGG